MIRFFKKILIVIYNDVFYGKQLKMCSLEFLQKRCSDLLDTVQISFYVYGRFTSSKILLISPPVPPYLFFFYITLFWLWRIKYSMKLLIKIDFFFNSHERSLCAEIIVHHENICIYVYFQDKTEISNTPPPTLFTL